MAHGKLIFKIPGSSSEAFEAFFNHRVRLEWDTLLRENYVEGGGTYPYVGCVTVNKGKGWKLGFSMRTCFLTYEPPTRASAKINEPTGLFSLWAASMHFREVNESKCELVYTYSIKLRPKWFGKLFDPIAGRLFARETKQRFEAMSQYIISKRST